MCDESVNFSTLAKRVLKLEICVRMHMEKIFGGSGWTRTNGVSKVTDLQSAAVAAMHTDPYGGTSWD